MFSYPHLFLHFTHVVLFVFLHAAPCVSQTEYTRAAAVESRHITTMANNTSYRTVYAFAREMHPKTVKGDIQYGTAGFRSR